MRIQTLAIVTLTTLLLGGAAAAVAQIGSGEESSSLDQRLQNARQNVAANPYVDHQTQPAQIIDSQVQPTQYLPSRRTRPSTRSSSSSRGSTNGYRVSDRTANADDSSAASTDASVMQPTPQRIPRRIKPGTTNSNTPTEIDDDTTPVKPGSAVTLDSANADANTAEDPQSQSSRRTLVQQPEASPAATPRKLEPSRFGADNISDSLEGNSIAAPTRETVTDSQPQRIMAREQTPALSPDAKRSALQDKLISARSPVVVVETIGPKTTIVGRKATYKIQLRNDGDAAANGVDVQIQGPNWVEVRVMHPTRGLTDKVLARDGESIGWRLTELPARAREELTVTVTPLKSDPFEMAVAWSFKPVYAKTLIKVQEPRLALNITGPSEVRYGESKVYRLTVSNPGTGEAEDVNIQLMPLDGGDQPMAVQRIGKLAAGASKALEVELTARQAGYLTINATATGAVGLKASASEKVLIRRAELQLQAKASPTKFAGTVATYQVRISNPGNDVANQIRIVAALPPGAEFVSASHDGKLNESSGKVTWTFASLAAQQEQVVLMRATLTHPGTNILQVNAQGENGLADSVTASTQVESLADLKLEVSDPRGPVPVNEEVPYDIQIVNRGTKEARDVEVVAFFSNGVEPVSVRGGNHEIGDGQVVFQTIDVIPVGGEVRYKIIAKAHTGGDHIFRTEVQCRESGTRLSAEETTHFFSELTLDSRAASRSTEPTPISDDEYEPIRR
jgi:uncharacterized repeat protein (TIGR01451 family)